MTSTQIHIFWCLPWEELEVPKVSHDVLAPILSPLSFMNAHPPSFPKPPNSIKLCLSWPLMNFSFLRVTNKPEYVEYIWRASQEKDPKEEEREKKGMEAEKKL